MALLSRQAAHELPGLYTSTSEVRTELDPSSNWQLHGLSMAVTSWGLLFSKWWIGVRPVEIFFGHLTAFQERELIISVSTCGLPFSSIVIAVLAGLSVPIFIQ